MNDLDLNVINYAVVDTETSGLTKKDVVIQCAIGFYDSNGKESFVYNKYWTLPPGLAIDKRAEDVHKITHEFIESNGLDAGKELIAILAVLKRLRASDIRIVAHNAAFDARLLKQTAAAHNVEEWDLDVKDLYCTMAASKFKMNLVGASGRIKAPSNLECFRHLCGDGIDVENLHDALTYMCASDFLVHILKGLRCRAQGHNFDQPRLRGGL